MYIFKLIKAIIHSFYKYVHFKVVHVYIFIVYCTVRGQLLFAVGHYEAID